MKARLRRALIVTATVAALTLGAAGSALADPAPGGNNPAYVCNGNQADPPPCPGS